MKLFVWTSTSPNRPSVCVVAENEWDAALLVDAHLRAETKKTGGRFDIEDLLAWNFSVEAATYKFSEHEAGAVVIC